MARFFGVLHVRVIRGEHLDHSYGHYRRRTSQASCYRKVVCGADLYKCGGADPCGGKPDPYVITVLKTGTGYEQPLARTSSINGTSNPNWNYEWHSFIDVGTDEDDVFGHRPDDAAAIVGTVPGSYKKPTLVFTVFDDDGAGNVLYSDDLLGRSVMPLEEIVGSLDPVKVTMSVKHPGDKRAEETKGSLTVEFRWHTINAGGRYDPPGIGLTTQVPQTYFKRTHGNLVRMYQDAHLEPGDVPAIPLGGALKGRDYYGYSCWDDLYHDLNEARHFICICGWSVWTETTLKRSFHDTNHSETVGKMLLRKANEGVQVVVMVWDDVTSVGMNLELVKGGLMATFDEYTKDYFQGTKVSVVMAKRNAGDDVGHMNMPIANFLRTTAFTHHQKIVLCDGPLPPRCAPGVMNEFGSKGRVLVSYVGGLDITNGRYDTPCHHVFKTLNTAHCKDFYNGCLAEASVDTGPREPWHDIHSRVCGPASWDVWQTYMERLEFENSDLCHSVQAVSNKLVLEKTLIPKNYLLLDPSRDPRAFDVQVFRSLDTNNSVMFNQKYLSRFFSQGKGTVGDCGSCVVDRGIQLAYLYHIARAKRFIYIENQYFLGSSHCWLEHGDAPCPHLVPYAITTRILEAIEAGERFCAYILTPLFPEGAPSSASVQEILQWQYQTMRFMYEKIGSRIKQRKLPVHPTDYLQFFFVGRREPDCCPALPTKATPELSSAISLKRFVIYVHSKMIIIDDEIMMCGSANINERSMGGCRDTEIAVAVSQPACSATKSPQGSVVLPKGEVSRFRLHLWAEHWGGLREEFYDPGTLECTAICREFAGENWVAFADENNQDVVMPHGHMCTYPHYLREDGTLVPSPATPNIPGTKVPVAGARSALLPGAMTT